ncbi:MAG: tetratricopeptide repeat protein [Deltaproteobacteria bacterium]|nr:tetratricopeptide repeat protein [Deltaproteobacteria bacterium]MBN2673589.1 tetratricopeptide repeat protein [Deltaproteobacteria bacterium]
MAFYAMWVWLLVGGTAAAETDTDAPASLSTRPPATVMTSAFRISEPPSAQQAALLEEQRSQDLELYMLRVKQFQESVNRTVERMRKIRRKNIENRYRSRIAKEEELEEKALKDAIGYFERFLKKYPDSPPYTPDAMFRLAELYYDDSYIAYIKYLDEYGQASERGRANTMALPEKEFNRSIALFQDLVRRYPDYENIDGAYYLLGYCLKEMGREEEARLAWLNLVCPNKYVYDPEAFAREKANTELGPTNPSASLDVGAPVVESSEFVNPYADCQPVVQNSRFFFESWWLIGNYHFDYDISRWGVETAIAAYQKLATDESHKFYDKGLYKLAWSYFKADKYPEAIETFSKVVDFSDRNDIRNSSMRPEAVQYLAVCLFTDDWDVDGSPDRESVLSRLQDERYMPQDKPWVREVYARLGDIYADNEKHEEAIEVWRLALERWPLDKDAPFVRDKIADSYRKQRKFDKELAERSKLDEYGPGTPWWNANMAHPDIQTRVEDMARDALSNAALLHHQQAQALKAQAKAGGDPEIMQFALEEYALAADAYRKYLTQNPDIPDAYELNYQLADALFWSGNYEQAKREYKNVRDSNLDDKFRLDASRMVIISLEQLMDAQIKSGSLSIREEPPDVEGDPPAPAPLPLPLIVVELMQEREAFTDTEVSASDAGTFAYQSAQNFYRYGHWDEAKKRYFEIYEKYCRKDEISMFSWKTLLNMAAEQRDLDAKEQLALLEQENKCGEGLNMEQEEGLALDTVLGDVAMQRAMNEFTSCMDSKDATVCNSAGDNLVAAVGRAPDHPSADAALHNAALAYENAHRNKTAMDLYARIVDEYPESKWVDKCLFKQAYSANAFFEYDQALRTYKILADESRFAGSEYRTDAILNTALILTNLQDYSRAAAYWNDYSTQAEEEEMRIEAAFNAADMEFRAKAYGKAVTSFESFIRANKNREKAGPYIVKAAYRIWQANLVRKRIRDVRSARDNVIDYYRRSGEEPGSMSAEYAAECAFEKIEEDMKEFESFRISGSLKQIEEKIKEGAERVKEFEARYKEVQSYRRPQWSLAAAFRVGYAYEVLAKAILNIPPPPLDAELQKQLKLLPPEDRELVMIEYEDKFKMAMEQHVEKMEQRAQTEYKLAIKMAREGNLSNTWSLLAQERMNAYDPDNYPRQYNGIVHMGRDTLTVPPWAPGIAP